MFKLVITLALLGVVNCLDVNIGSKDIGRKIHEEDCSAKPALWRRSSTVVVAAPEGEVITGIFVTDHRPKKDGVVHIVEGGLKEKIVVLKLKSPTVFRGYNFHVEVYSGPTIPRDVHSNVEYRFEDASGRVWRRLDSGVTVLVEAFTNPTVAETTTASDASTEQPTTETSPETSPADVPVSTVVGTQTTEQVPTTESASNATLTTNDGASVVTSETPASVTSSTTNLTVEAVITEQASTSVAPTASSETEAPSTSEQASTVIFSIDNRI
jgi:hypothetical protein